MAEPLLKFVECATLPSAGASPDASVAAPHRMAYWEWNNTGNPQHPHVIVCVHGLSRQGRDFDVLARTLSEQARVVCPDVVGRGRSDWLADPMGYQIPQYAADMLTLLAHVHAGAPVEVLDWVGTSMGGLIGMAIAGSPGVPLPAPVRRLVLNDVGPVIQWEALQRIGTYLGKMPHFESLEQAADAMWAVSTGFGPHTPPQWMALSRPMLKALPGGGWTLHYDPAIAVPFGQVDKAGTEQGEAVLRQAAADGALALVSGSNRLAVARPDFTNGWLQIFPGLSGPLSGSADGAFRYPLRMASGTWNGGGLDLTWQSRAGSTYRILAAPALADGVAFAPVATGIPGQPDFTTWPAPTSAAVKAFYRVDEE